jgi:hypothetical protein
MQKQKLTILLLLMLALYILHFFLEEFVFSYNDLTGTLPPQLCHVHLRLSCNKKFQCLACACQCPFTGANDT